MVTTATDAANADHATDALMRLPASDSVAGEEAVARARRAAASIGPAPRIVASDGGRDVNRLAKHGAPTATLGAGQAEIHTVQKRVESGGFVLGGRVAVALANLGA